MKGGIVILNYNDVKSTINLLDNLSAINYDGEIVVVDNNSLDNSFEELLKYKENHNIKLIKSDKNGGYSYGNNIGLKYLLYKKQVDYIAIANPDIIIKPNTFEQIIELFSSHPNCGLASPIMLDKNGKRMRMWLTLPKFVNSILDCFFLGRQINKLIRRYAIDLNVIYQQVEILPGSFLVFRASTLERINFLDENVFLFYEENIIGEKMKRIGMDTVLLNKCTYIHNHSITIKKNLRIIQTFKQNLKSKLYFEKQYHKIGFLKEIFLKTMMKYAVFEMSLLLMIRKSIRL